jgi:hypothetical protein
MRANQAVNTISSFTQFVEHPWNLEMRMPFIAPFLPFTFHFSPFTPEPDEIPQPNPLSPRRFASPAP